mmetsp:Transcript_16752/g.26012  ORF Transcript_16752/g.26012 Transcript_16752/m.26012 type:complete len:206 (+) Transcript_16752:206-823(+)
MKDELESVEVPVAGRNVGSSIAMVKFMLDRLDRGRGQHRHGLDLLDAPIPGPPQEAEVQRRPPMVVRHLEALGVVLCHVCKNFIMPFPGGVMGRERPPHVILDVQDVAILLVEELQHLKLPRCRGLVGYGLTALGVLGEHRFGVLSGHLLQVRNVAPRGRVPRRKQVLRRSAAAPIIPPCARNRPFALQQTRRAVLRATSGTVRA